MRAGRQKVYLLCSKNRENILSLSAFVCPAPILVEKRLLASPLLPREVGKPCSLRFLIPGIIPSFRARWEVGKPPVSKSLICVEAKEKDFYKTVREIGRGLERGCKWTVHL